jgi:hypothetical protein
MRNAYRRQAGFAFAPCSSDSLAETTKQALNGLSKGGGIVPAAKPPTFEPPREVPVVYIVAILIPPLGLLLNGQPFAAIFNLILIVPCLVLGLIFHVLLLVPSAHAVIAISMKREQRRHREICQAIERHGAPPGW